MLMFIHLSYEWLLMILEVWQTLMSVAVDGIIISLPHSRFDSRDRRFWCYVESPGQKLFQTLALVFFWPLLFWSKLIGLETECNRALCLGETSGNFFKGMKFIYLSLKPTYRYYNVPNETVVSIFALNIGFFAAVLRCDLGQGSPDKRGQGDG